MKLAYFESVVMIERLHRLFLEVIKTELERLGIHDISNVQGLVLYNIGKDQVTVGELTNRGYYQGSNVSYNLRKMVINGYLIQEPSPHDRRSSHVRLSARGLKLFDQLDNIFEKHEKELAKMGVGEKEGVQFGNTLNILENFWGGFLTRDFRR